MPRIHLMGSALSITVLLFHASLLFSQGSARIAGIITDPAGAVVPARVITVPARCRGLGLRASARSGG